MDTARGGAPAAARTSPPGAAKGAAPAQIAKGALRRLAQAQLEPTPDNYARAYADEAGLPPPPDAAAATAELKSQTAAWAALAERLARNLDRGGRQWTSARRKDSLKRLFDGSRSDAQRLQQRLQALLQAWENDDPADPTLGGGDAAVPDAGASGDAQAGAWPPLVGTLQATVRAGLPPDAAQAAALAARLATLADAVAAEGATADRVAAIEAVCGQARRWFAQRHRLVDELSGLCRELSAGLTELAEDDSWARGQALSLQSALADGAGLSVRGVRSAAAMLSETRQHQQQLRGQRQAAREALRQLIHDMLAEVGELGEQAGRFQRATALHAHAIEEAETLESLAEVVKALLHDTRAVQAAAAQSQQRLLADRARAAELEGKVRELEGELRRLSDEVSTDALTQVANRRGLMQAFEVECARCLRADAPAAASGGRPPETGAVTGLAVALIDIDNFKKLNDRLGHAAGDQALKELAAAVRERLRPVDHLARYGGEEFVVLLPDTGVGEAQQALSRLQRSLSEALFLHNGQEVFVTFSAGVTAWRAGEALPGALERADEALYEAKRSGKNRTCVA